MFYNFSWFPEPEVYAVGEQVLQRLGEAGTTWQILRVETEDEASTPTLQTAALTGPELEQLASRIEQIPLKRGFGGFFAAPQITGVKGFFYFSLDQTGSEARLEKLILPAGRIEIGPLQNPLLHLALAELTTAYPDFKRIYLGLPEQNLEDQAILAMYSLSRATEPGWWRKADSLYQLNRLAGFKTPQPAEHWLELIVQVEPDLLVVASNLLSRHGYSQRIIVEWPTTTDAEGEVGVDGARPVNLRTYLPLHDKAELDTTLEKISRTLSYLAQFRPVRPVQGIRRTRQEWAAQWNITGSHRAGRHLLIVPPGYDEPIAPEDVVLKIAHSSREVFGVTEQGPHPTTVAALELIEKYLDRAEHPKMLDVGTGTGILAIAAVKLGAGRVLAVDANPLAVEAARENTAHNGVSHQIRAEPGSLAVARDVDEAFYVFDDELLRPPPVLAQMTPFDLVVCNTLPHVIINLASHFVSALRPGGLLITSGIAVDEAAAVIKALADSGLEMVERHEVKGWVGLAHRRS